VNTATDYPQEAARLGIVPPNERKSVKECVSRGSWWVNGPVGLIMFGGFGLLFIIGWLIGWPPAHHANVAQLSILDSGGVIAGVLFVVIALVVMSPIVLAWIWWSITIPKWRIWALQNVDHWPELETAAIEAKLTWPRGSIFEKTEIKSREQRELEQALIRYRDVYG